MKKEEIVKIIQKAFSKGFEFGIDFYRLSEKMSMEELKKEAIKRASSILADFN